MNITHRVVIVAAAAICVTGCLARPTADEVGISKVPIMKGARLTEKDSSGAQVGDSFSDLKPITINWWTFSVDATHDEIVSFYKAKYPDAHLDYDPGDGTEDYPAETVLWLDPINSKIEELTISVSEGEFSIGESTYDK